MTDCREIREDLHEYEDGTLEPERDRAIEEHLAHCPDCQAFVADLNVCGASFGGEDHSGENYGAVITRGGYLIHTWGDRHYRHQHTHRTRPD